MKWTHKWNSSKKPRKQRNYVRLAPLHVRSTLLGSHLSRELREKHKTRSLRVRKGDKVKVMSGQHKGKTGTVDRVDTLRAKVFITGVENIKKDGTKAPYPIHPSNLLIQEIHSDKKRIGTTQ